MNFLGWTIFNLFLAFIPVVAGNAVAKLDQHATARRSFVQRACQMFLFVIWLAFLPNTCYLLTEWRHFLYGMDKRNLYVQSGTNERVLFHLCTFAVFYMLYSGYGALALTIAIRPIERLLQRRRVKFFLVAPFLFVLLSLGVYLGLIVRLNSWDLWARPWHVWASIAGIPRHPLLVSAILAFGLFLWGLYEAIDIWLDGVQQRLRPSKK